jgi:hypothetical protein
MKKVCNILVFLVSLACVPQAKAQIQKFIGVPGLPQIVYDPIASTHAVIQIGRLGTQNATSAATLSNIQRMMATLPGMQRYMILFPLWRMFSLNQDIYGHATPWQTAANNGGSVNYPYTYATTPVVPNPDYATMQPDAQVRLAAAYASVNLSDAANTTSLGQIGDLRGAMANIQTQIRNLQTDSVNPDASEVQVLQKTNNAAVTNAKVSLDQEKIMLSVLETQLMQAKMKRDEQANILYMNAYGGSVQAASTQVSFAGLGAALQNFRIQ